MSRRLMAILLALAYLLLPFRLSDFGLSVLNLAGIAAIGALGLNLLTGYCGLISLGHAAFLGVGAYICAQLGGTLGLPFPLWLVAAALAGGLVGLAVGPFAVRFRGHTLAVVTLALVFVAQHVFRSWDAVTGGSGGRADLPPPLGSLVLGRPRLGGHSFSPDQVWFWLVWAGVAVTTVLVANLVRGRPGRAFLAVRHGEAAAGVMGVDVARAKITAFVLSGALAAVAGALYGSYRQFVSPDEWSLLLSVEYLAIVLIGGGGTVVGPLLGALVVTALPRAVEAVSGVLPALSLGAGDGFSAAQLNQLVFGLLLVLFVLFEPKGLAALGTRLWARLAGVTPRRPSAG